MTRLEYPFGNWIVTIMLAGEVVPPPEVLGVWIRPVLKREKHRAGEPADVIAAHLTQCLQFINNSGVGRFSLASVTVTHWGETP